MKILLIEDDINIASFIIKGLRQEGFQVIHKEDGISGTDFALSESFDLGIVDIMLPGADGYSVIRAIRNKKITAPIIVLSAKREVDDKVEGLVTGADDYLVKPFAFSELVARINALLRRSNFPVREESLTVADLTLNLKRRKVFRNNLEIILQPKEFALLEYLLINKGRIISKTTLMEQVWDYNFDPQTNVVEARICKLRDKVDKPFQTQLIHTIKGIGYVLEERD